MERCKTERNPLFAGRWFDDEIILLRLRWYFRFKLSYRDLVLILSERGLTLAPYHDFAMGHSLRGDVREALEMLRAASRSAAVGVSIKPLLRFVALQTSYTWSKALDDTQGVLADSGSQNTDVLFTKKFDWGPSPFDVKHSFRLNMLYTIPSVKLNNVLAKATQGWWVGNIVSAQSGYPFSPTLSYVSSLSGIGNPGEAFDRASYIRADNLAAARAIDPAAVVFDKNAAIIGRPTSWFNRHMFTTPVPGYHGTVGRNVLRGPGIANWNLSFNKNTPLTRLGEAGNVQFRAEIFNVLNHPNFGQPAASIAGSATSLAGNAGVISSTTTTPRQVQFAVKVIF